MRTQLNGYVVNDQDLWLYDFFSIPAFAPSTVRNALETVPEGEILTLEINSGGGSVFAGFEMYSVLRSATAETCAEIQSLAASAASVLMLGCTRVTASPVAQIMIHLPSTVTDGDRIEHRSSIRTLDSITESLLNAYELKCGSRSSRAELRKLMETSTWMTATEAHDLGLVDTVPGMNDNGLNPQSIINCIGGAPHGIRSVAAMPMPSAAVLTREYNRLVSDGLAPPHGLADPKTPHTQDASTDPDLDLARAKLDLEKVRYGGIVL